ncbi:MAG: type I DNA topoisomerase, partial [Acidimicrobiia bacterium]
MLRPVPKPLVIVESPTKARTIAGYLGSEYVVESSMGHVRDLPRNASEVPEKLRGEGWARLGVNVDDGFEPLYVVPGEKKERIGKLRRLLKDADVLYLATDEDREGESIAWHLAQVLRPKVPVQRMVFHEITAEAIRRAVEHPRDIDQRLVDSQEARRILDRLYGYEVSPVLWRRVRRGLSAGRVQSVAVRIVVERERERMAFRSAGYWDVEGTFDAGGEVFSATLVGVDSARVATGRDFGPDGRLTRTGVLVLARAEATDLARDLESAEMTVQAVERKPFTRSPYPPFRTSTLQQEAGRKLRFTSARTMSIAQRLYEAGYITYMRTDSTALSEGAVASSRAVIADLYGAEYLPDRPRSYRSKVKSAQEAHEAIRPAGEAFRHPDRVARELGSDEARLYDLIWKRTVACQMADARGERVSVRLGGAASDGRDAEFATTGQVIAFPGFLRAYVEGSDDPEAELDDQERRLPDLREGDQPTVVAMEAQSHETRPPARYTEASLVRRLEELGVGRPSTYASIISTIQDRGYVFRRGPALVPSFTALAVVSLLERHFPDLVDYAFTARMEDDLDEIANGHQQRVPWLSNFYFGEEGLRELVASRLDEIDAREINSIPLGEDSAGRGIVVRVGRYGPFLEREDDTASIPEDLPPDELTVEMAEELLSAPSGHKILGTDPDTGLTVLARTGRFGPYVQLGEQEEGSKEKPRRASLFKSMDLDAVSLETALRLLSLPRVVGTDPETGEEVAAQNGRYGPYLKRGGETRSLDSEDRILEVTLEQALELFRQPARKGRRSAGPLRELGQDPASGKPVTVRSGRYGPYVTDGEVNASLRRGDDPDTIAIER